MATMTLPALQLDSSHVNEAQNIIGDLRRVTGQLEADAWILSGGDIGARSAVLTVVKQVTAKINELDPNGSNGPGRLWTNYVNGMLTWEKWKEIAGLQRSLIQETATSNKYNVSWGRMWDEVANPTFAQLGTKVTEVGGELKSNAMPLLVVIAVIFIAIAVIKVT